MGSWDVHCQASRLPIQCGMPAVILPIVKKKFDSDYRPASLPLFGVYGDYGRLENIEPDGNTELLEDHFKCDIEKTMDNIHEAWFNNDWEYMWFRRDVFNFLCMRTLDKEDKMFGLDPGCSLALTHYGFVKSEEKSGEERYTQKWVHPDGHIAHSDGTWSHPPLEPGKGLYWLSSFEEVYGMDMAKYRRQDLLNAWWDKEKNEGKTWEHIEDIMQWARREVNFITEKKRYRKFFGEEKKSKDFMERLMEKVMVDYELARASLNLSIFKRNCFLIHSHFQPYHNLGPQWADLPPFIEAHTKFLEIIKKQYENE
jgi:hypothetical protein